MRAVLLVLLLACNKHDDKLEQARRSAAEAKANAAKAESDAEAAQKKLEAARQQTAALIVQAKKKLEQLKTKRDAEADATKRAALAKQIDDLEKAIAQ
jgi:ABC-type enterochelin transport system substrate-binding protein